MAPDVQQPLDLGTDAGGDSWPDPPTGVAQLGYILLLVVGGGLALAGAIYSLVVLWLGTEIADGSLALGGTVIGLAMAVSSLRAFNARRWRPTAAPSIWLWVALLLLAWGAGTWLSLRLPRSLRYTLPPLILVASGASSLLFATLALSGLSDPVDRKALSGRLLPQHVVLLSISVSATFATLLSIVLEALVAGLVMGVLLMMTRWLGDALTLDALVEAARDPDALLRLEELIVQSPVALAGLGCIVVFAAPAIEELVKALPLLFFGRRGDRLTERAAILLGVASGVGFAFAENVGYLSMLADEWWLTMWLRVGAAVMHGAASGFVGRAWYQGARRGRWGAMLLDLVKGWGIHAAWNLLAVLVGWFAYQGQMVGVAFCALVGLLPLAVLLVLLARWGIWVSDR